MEAFEFSGIALFFLISIIIFFITQTIYYLSLYNKISDRNKAVGKNKINFSEEYPPISIIICAKDELANLRAFLPAILEQDYPEFEVIVINDSPTDGSDDYLTLLEEEHKNLYHSFTPNTSRYISHKKLSIVLGMKASKHEWLVFTEPNCRPASKDWLKTLARNFTPGTEIVLGCYGYERGSKWMNKKISFDTLFTTIRTLGFALAGKPYAGSGRNMAYRRSLFNNSKGFSAHLNLQRGDDDLFINQVATPNNTRVETSPEATMWMKPLDFKKPWREDKLNYAVTSRFYNGSQKQMLGLETCTRMLFYLGVVGSIIYGALFANWVLLGVAILLWLIRFFIQGFVINKTARSIGDKEVYRFSLPVFDFVQPIQSLQFKLLKLSRNKSEFMRR